MKIYNCNVCEELIYFENSKCLNCGSELGYIPVIDCMSVIQSVGANTYHALALAPNEVQYKKCSNYIHENVCNWMIPVSDPESQCISCRLNIKLPDLKIHQNRVHWHQLEIAKRRLIYSVLRLNLPLYSKKIDKETGLGFAFLRDDTWSSFRETEKVVTGHSHGLITINLAEANDAVREKVRIKMNERYRTLIGHFRHEVGHYYWTRLVESSENFLSEFREIFGDERLNYTKALNRYYKEGPAPGWQQSFISAYSSSHPWEDWAESWAHYLHMLEVLETANSWGITVRYSKGNNAKEIDLKNFAWSFDEMCHQWIYLSIALNNLNRSIGMPDIYPFILNEPSIKKMAFVQKMIFSCKQS